LNAGPHRCRLGTWFAIDVAARPAAKAGAALAAVGHDTRGSQPRPGGALAPLLRVAADASLRALDGVALARKVVTPIVIATSDGDEDIAPTLSARVSHGAYLRSTALWDAAARVLCTTAP
jgi:hypothetical protein